MVAGFHGGTKQGGHLPVIPTSFVVSEERSRPTSLCATKLGAESFAIKNFVNKWNDAFKFKVSNFAEQRPLSRGVIWHGGCVQEFLNTNVIVAADKDRDQVVMSLKRYLMEQNNIMGVVQKKWRPGIPPAWGLQNGSRIDVD